MMSSRRLPLQPGGGLHQQHHQHAECAELDRRPGPEPIPCPSPTPNEVAMKRKFPESQSFVVYDAGYGTFMDYYNAGFSNGYNGGKTGIALVKRGSADGSTLSFADKINNASSFSGTNYMGESYGVLAVLVYDSDPAATTLINMNTDNTSLTSAFISGVDGAAMIDALNAGQEVRITVHQQDQLSDWEEGGQMSSFTSWGSGSGLELKPEITAPGGNIWSTVMDSSYVEGAGKYDDYTGSYSLMSGTSMATPHMAGLAALVEQYVKSQHPQQDAAASADPDQPSAGEHRRAPSRRTAYTSLPAARAPAL